MGLKLVYVAQIDFKFLLQVQGNDKANKFQATKSESGKQQEPIDNLQENPKYLVNF